GKDDRPGQALHGEFVERDIAVLFLGLWLVVFARLAHLFVYRAQNAVYEPAGRISAEGFCNLDGLIDSNFWRNFSAIGKKKLCETDTQNISVDDGNFIYRPVGCGFLDDGIQISLLVYNSAQKRVHKRTVVGAGGKLCNGPLENRKNFARFGTFEIPLKECLENY